MPFLYLPLTLISLRSAEFIDIGGLDKQIQELIEAVVLPMTQSERFEAIGKLDSIIYSSQLELKL